MSNLNRGVCGVQHSDQAINCWTDQRYERGCSRRVKYHFGFDMRVDAGVRTDQINTAMAPERFTGGLFVWFNMMGLAGPHMMPSLDICGLTLDQYNKSQVTCSTESKYTSDCCEEPENASWKQATYPQPRDSCKKPAGSSCCQSCIMTKYGWNGNNQYEPCKTVAKRKGNVCIDAMAQPPDVYRTPSCHGRYEPTFYPSAFPPCRGPSCTPPDFIKTRVQATCATEDPDKEGPEACTSCSPRFPHHTIYDPKGNSGTCTKSFCPKCTHRACCGERHKHFVINSESEEGVCVRMNDDCTPLCMPHGDVAPRKPRMCTKGCNLLVKINKDDVSDASMGSTTNAHAEQFDMVVCQADKRVKCQSPQESKAPHSNRTEVSCRQKKEVMPMAICDFTTDLWNLGGTCITNHLYKEDNPQCPQDQVLGNVSAYVAKHCRRPLSETASINCTATPQNEHCRRTAEERDYCTRIALSF